MLRIKNLTISLEENILCRDLEIDISRGFCVIIGENILLRKALSIIFTGSNAQEFSGLTFAGDFELDDNQMDYFSFKEHLNPFIHFDSEDTVRSTIMFVNYDLSEKLISDFELDRVQHIRVVDLNVSMFKLWEMAIACASQSRIVYISQPFTNQNKFKYYLKQIKKYLNHKDSYIFVDVYDDTDFDFNFLLNVNNTNIVTLPLRKNRKSIKLSRILLKNQFSRSEKTISKTMKNEIKDFYGAFITNSDTSPVQYSCNELINPKHGKKRKFLYLLVESILDHFGKSLFGLKFIFVILITELMKIINVRVGTAKFIVLSKRSIIFLIRKVENKNETEKICNFYTSLGILIYSYIFIKYFKPMVLMCIYVVRTILDLIFTFIFYLFLEKIIIILIYFLLSLKFNLFPTKNNNSNKKGKRNIYVKRSKIAFTNFISIVKYISRCVLYTLFKIKLTGHARNFIVNTFLHVIFKNIPLFYSWWGIVGVVKMQDIKFSLINSWNSTLSRLEFNVISSLIILTVLYFNFNLVERDINFIRESLYVTIHPFNYFLYVLLFSFMSTLPILIFTILTNGNGLVIVYYNALLLSVLFNSFVNSSLKITIATLMMLINFLSSKYVSLATDILFKKLSGGTRMFSGLCLIYCSFCLIISLYNN